VPRSRPRRRKKHRISPAWESLLKARIDAAMANGRSLFGGGVSKGNTQRFYAEGSFRVAIRDGDVRVEDLLASSEVSASADTRRKWAKAQLLVDTARGKA